MRLRYKIIIGVFLVILLLRSTYRDPMEHWDQVNGAEWGDSRPKSEREKYHEERIKNGFVPHNNRYKSNGSNGYETIEIINETQYPGGYKRQDIKHKKQSVKEIDLTDPYIQDRIEDEMH